MGIYYLFVLILKIFTFEYHNLLLNDQSHGLCIVLIIQNIEEYLILNHYLINIKKNYNNNNSSKDDYDIFNT